MYFFAHSTPTATPAATFIRYAKPLILTTFILLMAQEIPLLSSTPVVNSREWLDSLLREKCKVPTLREHQIVHGMDLNSGSDLFLVIATGQGKTLVLHTPLIAAQARKEAGIGILIVPTKVLVEQQVSV